MRAAKKTSGKGAWPIKVSDDGRHFMDAQGEPFFWLGDTAWPLFVNYSPKEAESYLENRAAKGFTVIQGVLAWHFRTETKDAAPDTNFAGNRAWTKSPEEPCDAFFQHVDDLLGFAAGVVTDPFSMLGSGGTFELISVTRTAATALDTREALIEPLDAVRSGSLDPYATLRSAYRQRRTAEIANRGERGSAAGARGNGLGSGAGIQAPSR